MSNIKKIYDTILKLAESRTSNLKALEDQIQAQEDTFQAAIDEAAAAFDAMDVKAYHTAQDKQRAAKDTIDMLKKHYEAVKENPAADKAKYEELESQIRSEYDVIYENTKAKIEEHVAAIAALKPALYESWRDGEKALHALQFDVMNDAPYVTKSDGTKVPVSVGEKHLPDIYLIATVTSMVEKALADPAPDPSKWSNF